MSRWSVDDVERCLAPMRRYARVLARDPVAADDLVQEALLRAYEKAASFRDGAQLRPWLFSILHNLHAEGRRRSASTARALEAAIVAHEPTSGEADAEHGVMLREVAERMAALPPEQRAVLHLIVVEDLSYREAAETLGLPTGTVMSRLSRARAALRDPADAAPQSGLRLIGGNDAV